MNWFINIPRRVKKFFKNAPNKKHHLDFLIAMLSIPVLILAVTTSVINLQNRNKANSPTPSPVQQIIEKPIIIDQSPQKNSDGSTATFPTPVPGCIKKVGPVNIDFPSEGQVVKDTPLCITISYDSSNYCSVVWSYRINGGDWSNYTNNSPCLYNFPKGQVKFDLRVQSTAAQDQTTTLTRNFDYQGSGTATSSANIQ